MDITEAHVNTHSPFVERINYPLPVTPSECINCSPFICNMRGMQRLMRALPNLSLHNVSIRFIKQTLYGALFDVGQD